MLACGVAAWQCEVLHVADPDWNLVVTRSWCRVFFPAHDVGALARAEAELGSLGFERICAAVVLARSRYHLMTLRHGPAGEFEAHGIAGAGAFREVVAWVVRATAWDVHRLFVFQLDAHVEAVLVLEGLRPDMVVAGRRDVLALPIIEHPAFLASKGELGRGGLHCRGFRVVLDLSVHILRAESLVSALGRSETVVWCSFPSLAVELVITRARHQFIVLLLGVVIVQRRHAHRRAAVRANRVPLVVCTWRRRLELASSADLGPGLAAEAVARPRSLQITPGLIVARARHVFSGFSVGEVDSVASAHGVGGRAHVPSPWAVH